MPIYEYACQKCGHEFDALQKVSDAPLRKCPECGALRLKKLISAPQFRLKGSGWYETDFKKDGKKRLADGGDGKPAGSGDKPEAAKEKAADKTPDKPANAAEAKPKKGASGTGAAAD